MDYREHPPGEAMAGLVKTFWSLEAEGDPQGWIEHRAVPDGCIEIIRRLDGRSRWDGEQPAGFAVGLIDWQTAFAIGGGARFAAVRLWPWTWSWLSAVPLAAIRNRWIGLDEPALIAICDALPDFVRAEAVLADRLTGARELGAIGRALVESDTVEEMGRATGMAPRRLQRWFARHVGMPPRHDLRMLRFQKAFEQVPGRESLADHAAAHGFADQAHMAREFRSMAGVPATKARRAARGPFLR